MFLFLFLSAISLGMLLFLLASGLTIIFGLMRVLNVAHGSLYLVGAYVGFTTAQVTGSFFLATIAGALAGMAVGLVIQIAFMRHLLDNNLAQILLTFGFLLIIGDTAMIIWSGSPVSLQAPPILDGWVSIFGINFPLYRLFIIVFGIISFFVLDYIQVKTRIGAIVRAGADDIEMLKCMGYNVPLIFTIVFGFGSLLAGLSGVLGSVFLGIYPGMDFEISILAFIVVIVGGLGSVRGTFVASLLVGIVDNMSKTLIPDQSIYALYVLMIIVLLARPGGIFGETAS